MTFVHLNVHSKASLLYGSADLQELVDRAKKCGQSAIALTDYNNVFNAIHFFNEANQAGVKPIFGVDIAFCEDAQQLKIQKVRQTFHITLLAENDTGMKNIVRLLSESQSDEYYYYAPRTDFKLLEKYKEGVICLSGSSLDGAISYHLYDKLSTDGDVQQPAALFLSEGLVRRFLKIFDSSHFYLEVQNHGLESQTVINTRLRNIAKKYNIRTVATNNVYYVNQHDAEAHRTLLAMNTTKFGKPTNTDFSQEEYYLKTREEMECLGFLQDELDCTVEIAQRCNVKIDTKKRRLPRYRFIPKGKKATEYLRELCYQGLEYRKLSKLDGDGNETYQQRLDRELADIEEMGFADYFLIVHDVVNWIHNQNILLGRGRGSVGGSLVSYVLRITNIDPLKYGLIWERFLNKGRGGLPDIDTDVPRSQRQKVLDYIKERFGSKNVAQLVTLSGLQARAILKEVFSVYNMPFDEANKITALVPMKGEENASITVQEAVDSVPELKVYYNKYTPWFKIAIALEGCYKTTGIHAAAVVISDVPFDDSPYPLTRSKDGDLIFGWDMNTVDSLSLLKLDILGLTTLDDIQLTIDLVKKRRGISIDRDNIPLDDINTWTMISNGFTIGIFQIEKQLGRTWSKNLSPSKIEELSDLVSLIRPGPMESGMHTAYRAVKNNGATPSYIHDSLKTILDNTYSALLYQEQVIDVCKYLANMSLIDADKVRKAMGKKKIDEMKKWKEAFVKGCSANRIDITTAEEIWSYIEKFAGYGFNKSHGIGYALLAYETAYLKANYTVEFICAKLQHADSHPDKFEQLSALVFDAKLFDISVVPPRIAYGNREFAVIDDKKIAFGLSAMKGVGKSAISEISKLAKNSNSFDDILWGMFSGQTKVNSNVILALIRSGAFDDQVDNRVECQRRFRLLEATTLKEREVIQSLIPHQKQDKDWVRIVRALADDDKSTIVKNKYNVKIPDLRRRARLRELLNEYDQSELFDAKPQRIAWEQHYLGISLSGSEADIYKAKDTCIELIKNGEPQTAFEIAVCVDNVREITTKKGDLMAFVTARDKTYVMDNIVVFPRVFEKSRTLLEEGSVLKINGKLDDRGSLIADKVERLR